MNARSEKKIFICVDQHAGLRQQGSSFVLVFFAVLKRGSSTHSACGALRLCCRTELGNPTFPPKQKIESQLRRESGAPGRVPLKNGPGLYPPHFSSLRG